MPSDIFAKIGDIKGESFDRQLDHQLIKLGTDFDRVSDSFLDLIADAIKMNDAPAGALDAIIKHDVQTTGLDFIKLGDTYLKLDDALHKVDDQIVTFVDQFIIKVTPSEIGTDQGTLKLDFLQLETDLKLTGLDTIKFGLDFLKLNDTDAENANPLLLKIADDFQKLDDNLSSVGADFIKIGEDYMKLGDIKLSDFKPNDFKFDLPDVLKLDDAFTSLGVDTIKLGNDFNQVSDIFLKIAVDIRESSNGELPTESLSLNFSKIVFTHANDFLKLDSELQTLELDLKLVGNDYAKLSDAFHDLFHGDHGRPVITDTLGQVLELAHHFSLL